MAPVFSGPRSPPADALSLSPIVMTLHIVKAALCRRTLYILSRTFVFVLLSLDLNYIYTCVCMYVCEKFRCVCARARMYVHIILYIRLHHIITVERMSRYVCAAMLKFCRLNVDFFLFTPLRCSLWTFTLVG